MLLSFKYNGKSLKHRAPLRVADTQDNLSQYSD